MSNDDNRQMYRSAYIYIIEKLDMMISDKFKLIIMQKKGYTYNTYNINQIYKDDNIFNDEIIIGTNYNYDTTNDRNFPNAYIVLSNINSHLRMISNTHGRSNVIDLKDKSYKFVIDILLKQFVSYVISVTTLVNTIHKHFNVVSLNHFVNYPLQLIFDDSTDTEITINIDHNFVQFQYRIHLHINDMSDILDYMNVSEVYSRYKKHISGSFTKAALQSTTD